MIKPKFDHFELLFEVAEINDDTAERILDELDGTVSTHGGLHLVSVSGEGESCSDAALSVARQLLGVGAQVRRLTEDLVTRSMIADRTGLTPQGVGLWVRNERRTDPPFPRPYSPVTGGLWLWGEVNDWLRVTDSSLADADQYPTRDDYARVNVALQSTYQRLFAPAARSSSGQRSFEPMLSTPRFRRTPPYEIGISKLFEEGQVTVRPSVRIVSTGGVESHHLRPDADFDWSWDSFPLTEQIHFVLRTRVQDEKSGSEADDNTERLEFHQ